MKTREEIVQILAKRKLQQKLMGSTWADLVASIQGMTAEERADFVLKVVSKDPKQAGIILYERLLANANMRATADIENMLIDDALNLTELSSLL